MRDVLLVEKFQKRRQRLDLSGIGFSHHDSGVDTGQDIDRFLQKFQRTGTIKKEKSVTHKFGCGGVQLYPHLLGLGLGRSIPENPPAITSGTVQLAGGAKDAFQ